MKPAQSLTVNAMFVYSNPTRKNELFSFHRTGNKTKRNDQSLRTRYLENSANKDRGVVFDVYKLKFVETERKIYNHMFQQESQLTKRVKNLRPFKRV